MNFRVQPMLAIPLAKANIIDYNDWAIEEKFDGHRLIVEVARNQGYLEVTGWTRPRKHAGGDGTKSMAIRELPAHLVGALEKLPLGVYDGELVAGDTSSDVKRLDLEDTLALVLFDVLEVDGQGIMSVPYTGRREVLTEAVRLMGPSKAVRLAESVPVTGKRDVTRFVEKVWARGGEGGILKRVAARYQPGKRSPDFVKIKKLKTAVLKVVGWEPSRGDKVNRGPFAITMLRDDHGRESTVKTLNDAELAAFEKEWNELLASKAWKTRPTINQHHPALGRKLRIEFQDFTRDGNYRGPVIWDRWEDE